ncbi:MAG: hypothetical protein RI920_547, partial [Pseudomonadota bacterium]
MASKIEKIDQKIAELKKQRELEVSTEQAEKRKNTAHQNVIIGAWVRANKPDLVEQIKASLQRPQDRAAFQMSAVESQPQP